MNDYSVNTIQVICSWPMPANWRPGRGQYLIFSTLFVSDLLLPALATGHVYRFLPRGRALFQNCSFFSNMGHSFSGLFVLCRRRPGITVGRRHQGKTQALCPICFNRPSVGNVRLNIFMHGQTWAGIHFPEFIRVIELFCETAYLKKAMVGSSKKTICR